MYHNQQNFITFKNLYKKMRPNNLGLYLGAGVNLSPGHSIAYFKTYSWAELLETLYLKNRKHFDCSFQNLLKKNNYDWPDLAEELCAYIGTKKIIKQLDTIIYTKIPRTDKYGRLSKKLLKQAPSLHAAISFSAQINQKTKTSWTYRRNDKIGSILTTNYDFYFGAGWTRYQSFKKYWKVQTPFSQESPNLNQRTINYIHGYLPYKLEQKKDIVLTKEQYDRFYSENGFARNTLWNFLNNFHILFIGNSFSDKPLIEMLTKIKTKKKVKHYAIVSSQMEEYVKNLGVYPILIECYCQVPDVLSDIYCDTIDNVEYSRVQLKSPKQYWDRLKSGPNI